MTDPDIPSQAAQSMAPARPGDAAELLEGLTEAQRQAVTTTEGPLLVMAAAGSGKTRVITRRVAYLIRHIGIAPWQVLAITFTNKAAGEMRQRLAGLLTPRQAQAVTVCTFHALCARLMRHYADRIGLRTDYSIYDAGDQKRAIKQVMKDLNISTDHFKPDAVHAAISNAKNELVDADAYAASAGDFYTRNVAKVYHAYSEQLHKNNALDFDDLLLETARLLKTDEATRLELQDRFAYLLIDEYQDTNHAQFIIAHVLAARHRNICVVGDPDQSIYGWRGANIRNILEFEKQYPDAQVVALGQNWRSTPQILRAADGLIRHNRQRRHKPLFTDNQDGHAIRLIQTSDEEHEAQVVADFLREMRETHQLNWSDFAIFYRTNALSRVIEDQLLRSAIPYQVARGTAFYQRQEVRDAIAYLKYTMNEADEVALLRIINTPTRGIGNTSIERLQAHAAATGATLEQTLRNPSALDSLTPRTAAAIRRFTGTVDQWRQKINEADQTLAFVPGVRDVMEMIIRDSTLEAFYKKQDEEKLANLLELITAAARFDEEYGEADADLPRRLLDYLESVSLVADVDAVDNESGAVTLMTLHAAKGLEFSAVAMIGLEEGLLPHTRSLDDPAQMEEERRLCFVGITRAQRYLLITHARYRAMRGYRERAIPSSFLRELPRDEFDCQDLSGYGDPFEEAGSVGSRSPSRSDSSATAFPVAETRPVTPAAPRKRGGALPAGSIVRHPQFGLGTVERVDGAGPSARARVRFNTVGTKTLILEYARLERVEG
jgi:DNA helicase-2/ATP-dependent DNA helicase PcrA